MAELERTYLESGNIQVFPTSRRDDSRDRNARLNTEQNLVSIINRLTSQPAFIIDGLEVSISGNSLTIKNGSCNIHGYLFKILNDITYNASPKDNGSTVSFVIDLSTHTVGNEITFTELVGADILTDTKCTYNGLSLVVLEKDYIAPAGQYRLDLARWDTDKWVSLANSRLKYVAEDLKVTVPAELYLDTALSNPDVETNFQTWINNFIIDDGELS